MGKRFVTRSRQEWEALLGPVTESDEVRGGARRWLAERLEGYVQTNPESPVTLAVPDRFLEMLGDEADLAPLSALDRQQATSRRERPVR